jgi:hypothetical protein
MRIATFGIMATALLAAACSSTPTQRSQAGMAGSGATASGMASPATPTGGADVIDEFAAKVEMQRHGAR